MNNRYYQSSRSSITYIDNNNQIQLDKNSINDNNNKQFSATYKEKDYRQGKNIQKNFTNEEQLNAFLGNNILGNNVIDNNHHVKRNKKSKKKLKKSVKKRKSRKMIW
jgi:hypothetical protein